MKILKIYGIDKIWEIEGCYQCPCYDGEFDICMLKNYMDKDRDWECDFDRLPNFCPLPEKEKIDIDTATLDMRDHLGLVVEYERK